MNHISYETLNVKVGCIGTYELLARIHERFERLTRGNFECKGLFGHKADGCKASSDRDCLGILYMM